MDPAVVGILLAAGVVGYFLLVNKSGAFAPAPDGESDGGNAPASGQFTIGSMKLSAEQIGEYASNAGFVGGDLVTAIAIAFAESSGNTHAHGDLTLAPSGSYGLWQIYSGAHPEYGPDFTILYDPQTNATAAFAIYQAAGNNFTPWTTYNSGRYEAFMGDAQGAVNV